MDALTLAAAGVNSVSDGEWLEKAAASVDHVGFAVLTGVLDENALALTREALYRVQSAIVEDVGPERLERAGEHGVLRNMVSYDQHFLRLLELPEMLAVVDRLLSPTAILHLQNGFILPSGGGATTSFQHSFHMDFPRYMNGYVASVNVLLAIDAFTASNGGTIVVPATHQSPERPPEPYLHAAAMPVECPAGSMIVFDSTLWHAAGQNESGSDRLAINHQFTRSFFKQQIDYVRALGDDVVERQPARTQQLLGWYTRVVTSLDEYYRPRDRRLYRSAQG